VKRLATLLMLGLLIGLFALTPEGRSQLPTGPVYDVPQGEIESLDGAIGPGWNDATHKSTRMRTEYGDFPTDVYLKHNGSDICFALRIRTGSQFSGAQMNAWIFIDNGDLSVWNRGDDLIEVPERGGFLVSAGTDKYYTGPGEFVADPIQNSRGAGRWNSLEQAYEFEICKTMNSGDPYDVPFEMNNVRMIQEGFDLTEGGMSILEGESPFELVRPIPSGPDDEDPIDETGRPESFLYAYHNRFNHHARIVNIALVDQVIQYVELSGMSAQQDTLILTDNEISELINDARAAGISVDPDYQAYFAAEMPLDTTEVTVLREVIEQSGFETFASEYTESRLPPPTDAGTICLGLQTVNGPYHASCELQPYAAPEAFDALITEIVVPLVELKFDGFHELRMITTESVASTHDAFIEGDKNPEIEASTLGLAEKRDMPLLIPDSSSQPPATLNHETSSYMIGSVGVAVIFMESQSSATLPNQKCKRENWSNARIQRVMSQIQSATNWWANLNPRANLSFVYDQDPTTKTNYRILSTTQEPICESTSNQFTWINEAMNSLGYGNDFDAVRQFDNAVQARLGTDWAFTVFVVDSLNDADGCFAPPSKGRALSAYAYLGGPFLVLTYDNDGWGINRMNQVMAHEMGHIFWATDEYNNVLGETSGYLWQSETDNSGQLMDNNTLSLSTGTQGQIGWLDADGDGIFDPVDTHPSVTFTTLPISPTTSQNPSYAGNSSVNAASNQNKRHPTTKPYQSKFTATRPNVTINTIASVQYRINGGAWTGAFATDTVFDQDQEGFNFTASGLSPGTYQVEASAVNSVGNRSTSLARHTITVNPTQQTQQFTLTVQFQISGSSTGTVTMTPPGTNCGSTCSQTFNTGTQVSLTATPASGSRFLGWGGSCSGVGLTTTVAMNANKTCLAIFAPQTHTLTVANMGSGSGTVTSSPPAIQCGPTCQASFLTGTQVTLSASANTNSVFTGWSGSCSGTSPRATVTMTQNQSCAAHFVRQQATLSVVKRGNGSGTVLSIPSGIQCGSSCNAPYNIGTSVILLAFPSAGSTFGGWSGACSGPLQFATVTMNGGRSCTATFNTGSSSSQFNVSVDRGCGGIYNNGDPITVSYRLPMQANASIVDFDPRGPIQRIPVGTRSAGTYSFTGTVHGQGVETLVLQASTGSRVYTASCRFGIGVSSSLLNAAQVSTQRGCNATFNPGERISLNYSFNQSVSGVKAYIVAPSGVNDLTPVPLSSASGTIQSNNPIGTARGDRTVVLMGTTASGVAAATCQYTVP